MNRPRKNLDQSTRDRLVATATEMFHRQGYAALGVQEICAQAGVSKSSFYHFFPAKEALAVAVIESRWAGMQSALAPLLAADLPPLVKLRQMFAGMYAATEERMASGGAVLGCPFGTLGSELAGSNPAVRENVAAVFDGVATLFGNLLRAAVSRGELPQSFAVDEAADALLTLMQGMSVLGRVYNSPARLKQLGEQGLARILVAPVVTPA